MKRVISLLLIVCLLPLAGLPRAEAAGFFSDIPDTGTGQAAELLYSLGIVSGTGGTDYSPGLLFDRAALAVIGTKLSGEFDVSSYGGTVRFPDVRAGHWAHRWVNAATSPRPGREPIMSGSSDGRFYPDEPMLYGHLVTVLMKLLGYTDEDVGLNWPHSYIAKAEALGISKGMSFTANSRLTRGDAAKLIYNFLFIARKGSEKPYIETDLLVTVVPAFYQGGMVNQLIDKNGNVLVVEPDPTVTQKKTTVASAQESRTAFADGTLLTAASNAEVMEWDGSVKSVAAATAARKFIAEEPVTLIYRGTALLYVIRDSVRVLLRMERFGNTNYIDDFPVKGTVDVSLSGRMGWLRLDQDGNALGFTLSQNYTYRTVTAAEARTNGLYDGNELIPVRGTIEVWGRTQTEDGTYAGIQPEVKPGETFLLAYDTDERLQYLYRGTARGSGGYRLAVLETQPDKGSDPLTAIFGSGAAGAALYKNGFPATADMLEIWDVLMFYEGSGVVEVCNVRIYGFARFSSDGPTEVTILGNELELMTEAAAKISQFSSGQNLLFLLSADGRIADIRGSVEAGTTIGLAAKGGILVGSTTLELKGTVEGAQPLMAGRVGSFYGSAANSIFITPFTPRESRGDLNLGTMRLGSAPLAPWCVIYDQSGAAGRAVRLAFSDIPVSRVPANKILYAETGPSGYVSAIVLNDVSGDAYIYGFADDRQEEMSGLSETYTTYFLGVSPDRKNVEWFVNNAFTSERRGTVIGIAPGNVGSNGQVNDMVTCVRYEGITRFDFNGDKTVKVNGRDVPLAATEVYVSYLGETMSIADARAYCRTFEVYTDPLGYKVRFIIGIV